jgi:hypothetical protein
LTIFPHWEQERDEGKPIWRFTVGSISVEHFGQVEEALSKLDGSHPALAIEAEADFFLDGRFPRWTSAAANKNFAINDVHDDVFGRFVIDGQDLK